MRIYLFRGLFGFLFSTGMDDLAKALSARGYRASVHRWTERPRVFRRIVESKNRAGLVLIGHSLGANAASRLAAELYAKGRHIAYLATLDPTNPRPVPAKIVADNFRSSFVLARNIDHATNYFLPKLSHVQLDNAPKVHQFIARKIARIETKSKLSKGVNA